MPSQKIFHLHEAIKEAIKESEYLTHDVQGSHWTMDEIIKGVIATLGQRGDTDYGMFASIVTRERMWCRVSAPKDPDGWHAASYVTLVELIADKLLDL